ncbi:hypothetical protein DES32_2971 [Methylovirgula ligni]|uniref:Uncharacterized protein n=1 Tax=Methylovirgula ligni TaxID=569860 RepID=A0A3D9YNG8_9HYPH|nr:hypothetical protein [Methylovirgula ligni]REF84126.1 hypothetical protein DES32_2971 [Methylovirgula ligni]
MSEVKAIEAVDNALGALDADERARVLAWAQLKYGVPAQINTTTPQPTPAQPPPPAAYPPANTSPNTTKVKASKKAKTIISMDKTLNLSPAGKTSASQFASEKSPTNVMQKCVVAAYYLRDTIEMEKVTTQAVFTFFKHLNWPVPADLKNTLQQAGTAGWLDTADSQDIKLTSMGENLVEHDLPPKAKAK